MSDETKQDAPAYDDRGNVRPTDARYTGADRPKITPQEQAAIRDQEIKDGWARVAAQQKKLNAENEARLADAQAAVSPAPKAEAPADGPAADTELKGQALEDALKARDLPTTGTADEKRARVAEHDAQASA